MFGAAEQTLDIYLSCSLSVTVNALSGTLGSEHSFICFHFYIEICLNKLNTTEGFRPQDLG